MALQITAPLHCDLEPALQEIEVAGFFQIPSFSIIGLPAPEVAEARERVRAAIEASGMKFPKRRIVVNLAPASIKKRGTGLDLAVALAVLANASQPKNPIHPKICAWGELGLDGSVKETGQALRSFYVAWKEKADLCLFPKADLPALKTALARVAPVLIKIFPHPSPKLAPVVSLEEAWQKMQGKIPETVEEIDVFSPEPKLLAKPPASALLPLPPSLERLIALSASGHHHLLLLGPRGTGKSHALEWLIELLPDPDPAHLLTRYLLAELTGSTPSLSMHRRVGMQVRPSALIGSVQGGSLRPGEYSQAHGGILIADELPEWARDSRESLREPLERGLVTLNRENRSLELPATFLLAANGNLCPCGGWPSHVFVPAAGAADKPALCTCTASAKSHYFLRLNGPVLDRMDLVCYHFPKTDARSAISAAALRARVLETRARLVARWGLCPGLLPKEEMEAILVTLEATLGPVPRYGHQSLRARHKIARVALTLAAWDQAPDLLPKPSHFLEASLYRAENLVQGFTNAAPAASLPALG